MSAFTGESSIFGGLPPVVDEANPTHRLGQRMITPDGRVFRYVRNGTTALVTGNLLQSIVEDTGEQDLAVAAVAVGATSIVTTTTVTVTANQYAGGYVLVSVTPGIGQMFRILSHPAATAAALTITLEDPVQVALTTVSRIDLVPNVYDGVVAHPTSSSGSTIGVAVNDISISQYGWIQTGGVANLLNDAAGALTVGTTVMRSSSVTGAVRAHTGAVPVAGYAVTGIAASESGAIRLNLD
jgi:predicted RecA/RadA family phage recombinase